MKEEWKWYRNMFNNLISQSIVRLVIVHSVAPFLTPQGEMFLRSFSNESYESTPKDLGSWLFIIAFMCNVSIFWFIRGQIYRKFWELQDYSRDHVTFSNSLMIFYRRFKICVFLIIIVYLPTWFIIEFLGRTFYAFTISFGMLMIWDIALFVWFSNPIRTRLREEERFV